MNRSASSAFLGVSRSCSGQLWKSAAYDERLAQTLSQRLGLPELVGRVLAARGIDLDQAEDHLEPTLKALLPDPTHLIDMEQAAERLAQAAMNGETIGILGDYDVDGATSTALLRRYFNALGLVVHTHIPDRILEGYGPNEAAFLGLKTKGAKLVVTVDCGVSAHHPLKLAADAGIEVIVIDHHKGEVDLPAALAIVDPNRLDETSPHGHMAAVGVAFLLVVAVNRTLKNKGWFSDRRPPDPMQWLDIVALGTVCDVVPLKGVNRALVTQGLKIMARRGNAGIVALSDQCKIRERLEAFHCGYVLGPRLNAGGRVGQSDLGMQLLCTDDPVEAGVIAARLNEYNIDRQEIEASVLTEAIEQVESRGDDGVPLIVASGDGWHSGVIGIVASRLKDRYNRPAAIIAIEGAYAKGSARSVPGLDIGAAVIAARQAGLAIQGGGHAMAAGFTVATEKLPEFSRFLGERLHAQLTEPLTPTLELDGAIAAEGLTLKLVEDLRLLGPFGAGNPEPRFAVIGARLSNIRIVGQGHISFRISGRNGGRVKGIAFRVVDNELGQTLLNSEGQLLHLAGTLRIDSWQGDQSVQLILDDAAPIGHD